jgi:hypothetical protein
MIANITAETPSINIEGNISLINMKSSWGYFREIQCMADNLTISGGTSFQTFNTFSKRIYATNFSYSGKYAAYPLPNYIRADNARALIDRYLKANYLSPLSVITTPIGIGWVLLSTSLLIIVLLYYKKRCLFKTENQINSNL